MSASNQRRPYRALDDLIDVDASAGELNQALEGISSDVTAGNLSELTGGGQTSLHSHAGGGAAVRLKVISSINAGLANSVAHVLVFDPAADFAETLWNDGGWTQPTTSQFNDAVPAYGGYYVPEAGHYLLIANFYNAGTTNVGSFRFSVGFQAWSGPGTGSTEIPDDAGPDGVLTDNGYSYRIIEEMALSAGDLLVVYVLHHGSGTIDEVCQLTYRKLS